MVIARQTKLTYPHYRGQKHILSAKSGSTLGLTKWSDSYLECPMMEEPSFVQSCPHCGKCFFYQDAKPESLSQEQGLITSFIDKVMGVGTGEMKPMKRPGGKKWRAICEEADADGFGA